MSDAIAYATIRELGGRYRKRELSPVEVTRTLLGRIEQLDPTLHAFVTLTADRALGRRAHRRGSVAPRRLRARSWASRSRTKTSTARGVSAPRAVPRCSPTGSPRTTPRACGAGRRPAPSSWANSSPTSLRSACSCPAIASSLPATPGTSTHIPGGSSSGSGAALAAGLVVGATGSDTGGSIRGPAAFCGIVGLKPTYGRVSRAGVLTLSWTLDHTGPMARTVEDCAYLLQAMAGHDPADPASSRAPVDDYLAPLGRDIRGVKIGVPRAYFFDGIDPEVAQAFEEAITTLRGLGAEVRDVTIPSLHTTPSFFLIVLAEAFAYHEHDIREHPELYGDVLRERILTGALVTAAEYTQAQRLRAQLCREMAEVLRDVDVLATPTTPTPATSFTRGAGPGARLPAQQHGSLQLTGLPTLALPCGFTASGLPLSLQLAGRPFEEGMVLRVGHAYEQATPWHTRRPPV